MAVAVEITGGFHDLVDSEPGDTHTARRVPAWALVAERATRSTRSPSWHSRPLWHPEDVTEPFDDGRDRGCVPPPSYPPSAYPPLYGQYPGYESPSSPWGHHPVTGESLSEKSKTTAGLLQLLGLLYVLGIGRIYMGNVGLGVAQLLVCLIATPIIGLLTCGIGLAIPFVWTVIDVIVIFSGKPRDQHGRLLRDGV